MKKYIQNISGFKFLFLFFLLMLVQSTIFSQTQILKWKDGKSSCVTITYDDGSKNQFDIAIPVMDNLGLPGTFFINTVSIKGSENMPTFVGRPIMEILNESSTIPTGFNTVFERTSMIRYLREILNTKEIEAVDMYSIGSLLEKKNYNEAYKMVDDICADLRKSKKEFEVIQGKPQKNMHTSWDDLKIFAKNGHEIANHTISHPHLSTLDKANILYETEKCKSDIEKNLGFDHTLTIEGPYGIHDDRVIEILYPNYPFLRNRAPEDYFEEILRHDSKNPAKTEKEYIHWQRGPLSKTPYTQMTSWIDTTMEYNIWLVLVFHGIEGIGWEAIPAKTIERYFRFIKEKEDQIWVATYQDAYKYIRERMNSKIESIKNENSISVELTNTLDAKIYNQELTLKTIVPDSWKSVEVRQGNQIQKPVIKWDKTKAFVVYNASPNAGAITLSNGINR